jgi:hypothetical protein
MSAMACRENDMPENADVTPVFAFIAEQIADAETEWSLGTFGAIAEFRREAGEPVALTRAGTSLAAVTAGGGIRIAPAAGLHMIAFESTTKESWNHRIALCLPEAECVMSRRSLLTELGPDMEALRDEDRATILFDLGLDTVQVDLCVRVADPDLAAKVRACVGRSLFEPGNPAMGHILGASPHRVFVSRLGRAEVYAQIPPHDGVSPQGPHTHVLPNLLVHKRTHAATEPSPDGYIPCAHLYPAHPAKNAFGEERPFDRRRHESFQRMLRAYGDPARLALKHRVTAAILAGEGPSAITISNDRFARTSVRVALRQVQAARGPLPALSAWIAAYDRPRQEADDGGGHASA